MELPLHHYNGNSLYMITSCIGTPLKLDQQMALVSRGNYTRVCVHIDLDKPLLPAIGWKRSEIKVEYEGIPLIFMHCGMAGQHISSCPTRPPPIVANSGNLQEDTSMDENSERTMSKLEEKTFVEWMLPCRRTRRNNIQTRANKSHSEQHENGKGKYQREGRAHSKSPSSPQSNMRTSVDTTTATMNTFNVLYEESCNMQEEEGVKESNEEEPPMRTEARDDGLGMPRPSTDINMHSIKEGVLPMPNTNVQLGSGQTLLHTVEDLRPTGSLPLVGPCSPTADTYVPGVSKWPTSERPETSRS
ncbi:hypothetical protein LINGRAHAP2_LOCUS18143 [Linum grandiflorum]